MNNQVKLGLFVAIGIFGIIVSIVAAGNFTLNRSYKVYVAFHNASGLTKKAKVKIAGVDIGVLKGVTLKDARANLCLAINKDIVLYRNASASIVSMGIIGTKYIEILPGDPGHPALKDGDTIEASETLSLEQSLGNMIEKINGALGTIGSDGKIGGIIDNISAAAADLKLVIGNIAQQNAKITNAIANINKFSYNLAEITGENREDIRSAIASIKDVAYKLDILVDKVNEGEGTLATLINDGEMSGDLKETIATAKEAVASAKTAIDSLKENFASANRLQLEWDYAGRYSTKDEKFRSDIGIGISMRKERFYYVGISNVADASEEKDQKEKDTMNTLTVLLGFRGEKASIYGGVMRSKAGGGIGYSFFDPIYAPYRRLQAHFDAFNFGRKEKPPEFNLGVRYGITRWLYAGVMVEDIAYSASVTPYIKLEIKDTDITSLLGIASVAAVASR